MCWRSTMLAEAQRLYKPGDVLSNTGARNGLSRKQLDRCNLVNFHFNDKGTLVCGTGRTKNIVLWNEGQWAAVVGRTIMPNVESPLVHARNIYTRGVVVKGGVGPRRGLGSATINSCSFRFNEKSNIVCGDILVWSQSGGYASTTCGEPCDPCIETTPSVRPVSMAERVENGCPVTPMCGAEPVLRISL